MSDFDEITRWMNRLMEGDSDAANELWRTYWERLVTLARSRLSKSRRRVADEEDVALSAFNSFCKAAQAGRFPDINDRHDLWKLLVTITTRKAVAQMRREHAQKRGDCNVRGESVFNVQLGSASEPGLSDILTDSPTPALAAMAAEQIDILFGQLDAANRQVALLKCEGYGISEIAQQLGCAAATVRRRLRRIQHLWSELLES